MVGHGSVWRDMMGLGSAWDRRLHVAPSLATGAQHGPRHRGPKPAAADVGRRCASSPTPLAPLQSPHAATFKTTLDPLALHRRVASPFRCEFGGASSSHADVDPVRSCSLHSDRTTRSIVRWWRQRCGAMCVRDRRKIEWALDPLNDVIL
uniref:Uncharacterized protein n=1 Tax=Haptolina ericina TaxID=156174 RepID=A0A7S3B2C0_9EUKA